MPQYGAYAPGHPLRKAGWVRLFRKTFLLTGRGITGEFLISLGRLPGAQRDGRPVARRIAGLKPHGMAAASALGAQLSAA